MNELLTFSSDGADAYWTGVDGEPSEHASVRWDNEAWTVTVRLLDDRVEGVFRLSPLWQLRQFMLFRDLDQPDLWLGTDGRGHWGEVNGAHRPELDGAFDLTIGDAVTTRTLTIRRLQLDPGRSAQVKVLEVDPETLAVETSLHQYHRLDARRWRVTRHDGAGSSSNDDFDVDDHGVAVDTAKRRRVR